MANLFLTGFLLHAGREVASLPSRSPARALEDAARARGARLAQPSALVNGTFSRNARVKDVVLPKTATVLPRALVVGIVQRQAGCFCLEDERGNLKPSALWLGEPEQSERALGRASNEITGRLASVRRAYLGALAEPIDVLRARVDGMRLHPRMGTLGEHARRLPHIVESLCRHGVLPEHERAAARAAALCQLDLAMEPVQEDDSLHGLFGSEVFRARGEDSAVALALESHVRPTAAGGDLALDASGALLGIAHRLDVLVQAFSHGVVPTPSGDPLGLRERAYGMLRTMLLHDVRADLGELVEAATRPFASDAAWLSREDVVIRVRGFLRHRLKILLSRRFPEERVHELLRSEALCPSSLSEKLEGA